MCTGDEILIQPIQAEHVSNWYWNTGDTGSSIEVKDAGIYTLRVANVCGERTDSIEITAANPTEISIGPDTQFCKTFSYRLGASDTLISGTYYWSPFGQQTPSITTGAYGKYILSYTNEYGCKSRDTLLITEHCHSYIHVPSSFSPNGDGINDLFGVVANEIESFNILIFNCWGEIIYKSNELEFAWDGKYLGVTVQQDVYYYLISYSYLGVPYHMKGSLTVIW
jgi:gliding motility-associated-like protein